MAGASMKDIKLRIRSVESTKQITSAMQLVETSMGYASIVYDYDAQNRRISETYLNTKDLPVMISAPVSSAV